MKHKKYPQKKQTLLLDSSTPLSLPPAKSQRFSFAAPIRRALQTALRHKKRGLVILGAAAALCLICLLGCPIRNVTGVPCPGCGMTRACLSAMRLDFKSAFFWHPLWVLSIPLIAVGVFRPEGILKNKRVETALWIALGVLFLGVYVLRMALLFPHTPPMDYNQNSIFYHIGRWMTGLGCQTVFGRSL